MTTAANIITATFQKIGIDNPTVAQTASALISLNNMISSWGVELLTNVVVRESKALTAGTASYTIGAGGDFNTIRPIKIDTAYLSDTENYDWPLQVINAKEHNDIYYKSIVGRPRKIYFIPEYPLAKIIFDCEPDVTYTLYVEFIKNFTEFAATTTNIDLPNEYKEALIYNLAISLAEDWDRNLSKTILLKAMMLKENIGWLNAITRPVPESKFELLDGGLNLDITTDIQGA